MLQPDFNTVKDKIMKHYNDSRTIIMRWFNCILRVTILKTVENPYRSEIVKKTEDLPLKMVPKSVHIRIL